MPAHGPLLIATAVVSAHYIGMLGDQAALFPSGNGRPEWRSPAREKTPSPPRPRRRRRTTLYRDPPRDEFLDWAIPSAAASASSDPGRQTRLAWRKATANRPLLLHCCSTTVSSNERLRIGDWMLLRFLSSQRSLRCDHRIMIRVSRETLISDYKLARLMRCSQPTSYWIGTILKRCGDPRRINKAGEWM